MPGAKTNEARLPRQRRSRALFDAIVQASAQLFSRQSVDEVTIRSVAERAGVSVGSLYQYFEGRDGLLEALLEHATQENFEAFVAQLEAAEDRPIEEAVDAMVDQVLDAYLARPLLTRALTLATVVFGRAATVQAERDRFVHVLADHLARRLPGADRHDVFLRASIAADMVVGAAIAEAHRPTSAQRKSRLREMACRTMRAELRDLEHDGAR